MNIEVALYGEIARAGGGKHVAVLEMTLPDGAKIRDLLTHLGLKSEDVGLVFVNSVLHDLPGLSVSRDDELHQGDHVGLFAINYVWPYQYRDGTRMSPKLEEEVAQHGYMRHRPHEAQ